jgi:hypothetical protein
VRLMYNVISMSYACHVNSLHMPMENSCWLCLGIEPKHPEVTPEVVEMTRWFTSRNLASSMPDAVCQVNQLVRDNRMDETGPFQVLEYTRVDLSNKTKYDSPGRYVHSPGCM